MERKIEDLFKEEPFDQVDEELFKWLIFSYFQKGNGIKNLNSLDFERFKEKLAVLVDAIYQWHQERKDLEKT
ncbi:hypothetical protein J3L19_21970 [Mucilaginibacter rubeus]|uniref:hypothetical protein n=1 Tax=Mucilaginibacter TaxID=423349 RepID=UPI0011BE3BD4|nr:MULTISPECIES: hypothetical protein [Mucilaginibacter]QTE41598.1 hypothetical protein J3L19_21970 [Mucilaginibacter rubeus]